MKTRKKVDFKVGIWLGQIDGEIVTVDCADMEEALNICEQIKAENLGITKNEI